MNGAGSGTGPHGEFDEVAALPAFVDPVPGVLLDGWKAVRGADPIPRRADLDPLAFSKALPWVWIFRRLDGDFRCELFGEQVRTFYSVSPIGRTLSELINPGSFPTVRRFFDRVADGHAGYARGAVYSYSRDQMGNGERLLLPLRDHDDEGRSVIGVTVQRSRPTDDTGAPPALWRCVAPLP